MNSRSVIHIGYPKTGTTFLQDIIFPKYFSSFRRDFFQGARGQVFFQNSFGEEHSTDCPIFVSEEGFCAHETGISCIGKLANLKTLFPDGRVILVLREPQDLMFSLYSQASKNLTGPKQKILKFSDFLRSNSEDNGFSYIDYINYFQVIDSLIQLEFEFSVYFYEDFQTTPVAFIEELARSSGLEISIPIERADFEKRINVRVTKRRTIINKIVKRFGLKAVISKIPVKCRRLIAEIVDRGEPLKETITPEDSSLIQRAFSDFYNTSRQGGIKDEIFSRYC